MARLSLLLKTGGVPTLLEVFGHMRLIAGAVNEIEIVSTLHIFQRCPWAISQPECAADAWCWGYNCDERREKGGSGRRGGGGDV